MSKSSSPVREPRAAQIIIPLIRTVATLGFVVAPCSLGFVIIAVSDQLIRSIMVGDDPELLVGDLQNRFPHHVLEVADADVALVAQVVNSIERPDEPVRLPLDARCPGPELRC